MRARRLITSALLTTALATIPAMADAAPKAPKAGQFCKKADIGKKIGTLKCTKDGTRARWR